MSRLGHNNDDKDELVPRDLEVQFGGARALSLAAGEAHTMVVTTCGAVWGCGRGAHGQLGVGDTADRHAPVRVGGEEAFGQSKVHMVACGDAHTVAVTEEGVLWSWGCGEGGRLGHNDDRNRLVPARVGQERFGGAKIITADCGGAHFDAEYDLVFKHSVGNGDTGLYQVYMAPITMCMGLLFGFLAGIMAAIIKGPSVARTFSDSMYWIVPEDFLATEDTGQGSGN